MIFHQFGDDFVLALELVTQGGDGSLEVAFRRGVLALEGAQIVRSGDAKDRAAQRIDSRASR